jgi:hypothetical protein
LDIISGNIPVMGINSVIIPGTIPEMVTGMVAGTGLYDLTAPSNAFFLHHLDTLKG